MYLGSLRRRLLWRLATRESFLRLSSNLAIIGSSQRLAIEGKNQLKWSSANRSFSSRGGSFNKSRDLYSRLGVSPRSTQAQIKEAYYKLSMKYHPDRNHGNQQADALFKEITEAYSILGQNQSRRKYDRGLLREYPSPPRQSHSNFHSTDSAHKNTPPMYDFDAFYQAHYGQALKREQMARARRARQKETHVKALSDVQQQLLIVSVICLVLLCGWHYGWGLYSKELRKQRTSLVDRK